MTPHFPHPQIGYLDLIKRVAAIIRMLPDLDDDGQLITCHAVCRSISHCIDYLHVEDGYFGALSHEHSWLRIGTDPNVILDPYPWVCIGGPIIVDVTTFSPWRELYRREPLSEKTVMTGLDKCLKRVM